MDLVLEILERVATDPNNEGQTHRLLVEAAAEIARLRSVVGERPALVTYAPEPVVGSDGA